MNPLVARAAELVNLAPDAMKSSRGEESAAFRRSAALWLLRKIGLSANAITLELGVQKSQIDRSMAAVDARMQLSPHFARIMGEWGAELFKLKIQRGKSNAAAGPSRNRD